MYSIATLLGASSDTLASRITDTTREFTRFYEEKLSPRSQARFALVHHRCIPNASAMILDGDSETGLLQLETKAYRSGMGKSYGFELGAGSELFLDLRESYRQLIRDGVIVLGKI